MAFGSTRRHDQDSDHHDEIAEINMIPLVDVMLVLLIIFMVAAPLSITGIKINLPTSQAKGELKQDPQVILSIDAGGNYYVEKMKIPGVGLTERLKAMYEFRESKDIYIRADRNVRYEKVVEAMSAAKLAGVQKIAMLTTAPQQKL
ncbi:MAG: biopolymer transporter ExbD [Oligoflexales bacterium]|nr:biopolymer transporter ExbD [Oligoflexales bacterium]